MRDVCVIGIGQTPIGELWDMSLRQLAFTALQAAVKDAGIEKPEALYVGNMLASRLSDQTQLGALIADFNGWRGIEATTVEAACASGGVAFQAGVRAVASGMMDVVAVCGVEKMTDATTGPTVAALATAADADFETAHGATFVALNALIMQRYMHEYRIPHEAFAPFSINAHRNAKNNPNAMFHMDVTAETYRRAPVISEPINRLDSSPICDGAAAVILCPLEMAQDVNSNVPIRVRASITATDSLDLGNRNSILHLQAAQQSAQRAYEKSGLSPQDIDVFEAHDAFSIIAALSLEAAGFAEAGRATHRAQDGDIFIGGRIPVSTMGGLKGRGHPIGATGIYEIVDVITQLRGDAGLNQVKDAQIGMTQNIGGTGATVVTHIFSVD